MPNSYVVTDPIGIRDSFMRCEARPQPNLKEIPWFSNIVEAENFCMSPVGSEDRLVDKAKKDFLKRRAIMRNIMFKKWAKEMQS